MAVKNFPDISPDANPSFTLESNTSSFESTLNKNVQHMELPGARWRGSVAFSNRTRQEANKIKAFMTSLGGQVGRFYLTPFDAYQSGTMSGAGVVDGTVSFGASTIPTKGWNADQDKLFEAGDYLEVGGELKMVPEDVETIGNIYNYTIEDNFDSQAEYDAWGSVQQTGVVVGGILTITSTGTDPQMIKSLNFNGNIYNQIKIRSKITAGSNFINKIFYRTSLSPSFDGVKIFDFSEEGGVGSGVAIVGPDADGFFTYTIDCTTQSLWLESNIIGIRIDFTNNQIETKTDVDYIYIRNSTSTATADVPIVPPLRKSLTGGESITVVNPKGKFYLGSNDQSWDINVNGVQSMGFDFIEDVN